MTIRKRRKIVLLLVGLDSSGKTATAKGLLRENVHDTVPTVGFSSYTLPYKGYSVVVYDLGGGPQIRDIWSQYYVDVHGIIYVIDASDPSRISESGSLLHQLLIHEKLKGKPLLLLANKQDVEGALDEIDVVEKLNLEAIVNEQKCPTLVETCCAVPSPDSKIRKAYLDPGIQNGFRWLLNIIIKDFHAINGRVEADTKTAQVELAVEKENRRKRVEEQRRQREEIEGTVIIPLRDSSPDSVSRIITVQPSAELAKEVLNEETAHPSDSQDSGFTAQNGDAEKDGGSTGTVGSRDSAIQSMQVENGTGSKQSASNQEDLKSRVFKKRTLMKRSNKTAPSSVVPKPKGLQSSNSETRPAARHRLPPLTPPPNHVKMFEAKPSRRANFVKSTSLSFDRSESDLTDDERSLNLVSFPSDWKLLRNPKAMDESPSDLGKINDDGFGKTFTVSNGLHTSLKEDCT